MSKAASTRDYVGPGGETSSQIPGMLVRRAQQIATAIWLQRAGSELTAHQYAVLRVIHETPGLDQTSMCARAYFDRSTGADIVVRLAKNGLLVRVPDVGGDSRRKLLYLTEEGVRAYERLANVHAAVSDELLSGLDEGERPEFMRLLQKLVEGGERRVAAGRLGSD